MNPFNGPASESPESSPRALGLASVLTRIFAAREDQTENPENEELGESRFTFWSGIGFSTGLLGIVCLLLSAFFVGEPLFERNRNLIAIALGGLGVLLVLWGRFRSRRQRAAETPAGQASAPPIGGMGARMSVLSWEYLGVMVVCMGAIVFLLERQREEKPVVVEVARQVKQAEQPAVPAEPVPPPTPPPPAPQLKIQGLLYSASNPTIIVDGQAYGVGDTVDGVNILEIHRESVLVRHSSATNLYTLEW